MPKAFHIRPSTPALSNARRSDVYELVSVALFAGAGLLASLVVVLMSMNGM
jgi:hypothetical protein